jgi:FMN-dependent NADH-azoreductase
MTQILYIQASPRTSSISHDLADQLLAKLQSLHPGANVVTRDLIHGLPLISDASIAAFYTPADDRSSAQKKILETSDNLIDELKTKSDILVISTPMHNWGMPAVLKAWIDWVVLARQTFRYKPDGSGIEGLLKNRKTYLVIATGGVKVNSPGDFLTPHLTFILNIMGITDIEIIAADGTSLPNAADIIAAARAKIDGITA